MAWIKQDAYSIKNGEWIIAKFKTTADYKYGLSRGLNESFGFFKTADEAKAKYKALTA